MSKNVIIILAVVILMVIGGIIIFNFVLHKEEISSVEQPVSEENLVEEGREVEEVIALSAVVLNVNVEDNFLTVKPVNKEEEIKIIIGEETKMIKLGLPAEAEDLPKEGGVFVPTEKTIDVSGFKEGDNVFIMASSNLAGKTEIDDVLSIQILP